GRAREPRSRRGRRHSLRASVDQARSRLTCCLPGQPCHISDPPSVPEVTIMHSNRRDTAKGITDEAKGRVKEAVGKATGNRRLQAEGKIDQAKGKVRKASGRVKRAARDVGQAVDRATR